MAASLQHSVAYIPVAQPPASAEAPGGFSSLTGVEHLWEKAGVAEVQLVKVIGRKGRKRHLRGFRKVRLQFATGPAACI